MIAAAGVELCVCEGEAPDKSVSICACEADDGGEGADRLFTHRRAFRDRGEPIRANGGFH